MNTILNTDKIRNEYGKHIEFALWHILKMGGQYQLLGELQNKKKGGVRITSPVVKFDTESGIAITSSGNKYRLLEGSTISIPKLKSLFLDGYCKKHGINFSDVEIVDELELELALATPMNTLQI